jgi:quercetin dioxygenase-like cupin family protein
MNHVVAGAGTAHQVMSDQLVVKAASPEVSLFEVSVPPGGGPPLHRHAPGEVFYVLEGTFAFGEITAGPGDTVIIPPHEPHTYKNVGEVPGRFLAVISPGGMESFFSDMVGPPDMERILAVTQRHGVELLMR